VRADYIIRTDQRKRAEADTVAGASPLEVMPKEAFFVGAIEPNAFHGSAVIRGAG